MDSKGLGTTVKVADIEWPTIALMAATYAVWFMAGSWLYPHAPILALVVLGFAVAHWRGTKGSYPPETAVVERH